MNRSTTNLIACLLALIATLVANNASAATVTLTDTVANFSSTNGTFNGTLGTGAQGTSTYGFYEFTYNPNVPGNTSTPSTSNPASGTFVPYTNAEYSGGAYYGPLSFGGGGGFPIVYGNGQEHGITNPNAGFSGPNGDGQNFPAGTSVAPTREWTSNFTGNVTISGTYQNLNFCCNAGETANVYLNGVQTQLGNIGPANGETSIGFDNTTGTNVGPVHTYSFTTYLHAGENVMWVMDPGNNFYGNLSSFTGTITYTTPEPASLVLCGLGALGLLIAVRKRRQA